MLLLQRASKPRTSTGRIGLAVAGGGPLGGMYELGALRALDDAIGGLDLTRLDAYVGVSSGAFLAAGLANRMSTAEMARVFIVGDATDARFRPEAFLRPAFQEYARRLASLPRIFLECWHDFLRHPGEPALTESLARLVQVVPAGLFDNGEVERFLRDAFTRKGRSNDFRKLDRPLSVVAVDLDNGEAVRFGGPGWEDVPISLAIQASSALPGLYPPVEVRGRQFVDGALRRTMHASVALDQGIDLLFGLNPLVPFAADAPRSSDAPRPERLVDGGLPVVLSQTFRTLLQSRVQVGMAKYPAQYAHADQIVFEPDRDDAEMFFTNVFSYASRRRMSEHAYRATLADLRRRRNELDPVLARHGLSLRADILDDPARTMLQAVKPPRRGTDTTERLHRALDDLDAAMHPRPPGRRRPPRRRASAP